VIQAGLIATIQADLILGPSFTSTSMTAIWLLLTYVFAVGQNLLEGLWDAFLAQVQAILAAMTPHTLQWYATMAKAFQYGDSLPDGSTAYSPVAAAGDPSMIVAFSAVVEVLPYLRIKVATSTAGVLGALSGPQLTAFTAYMNQVKDAGVPLNCTSGPADTFQPTMIIYYDPQVLLATGARIDGTDDTPVLGAVNAFLSSLPFNGVFDFTNFVVAMKAIDGVISPDVQAAQAYYGAVAPKVINEQTPQQYVPDAGYMALDTVWFGLNVSYQPYSG